MPTFALVVTMLAGQLTPAPTPAPTRPVPQRLDFAEGDLIEGTLERPEVEVVSATPRRASPSLVRVRQDFRAQVLRSVSEL